MAEKNGYGKGGHLNQEGGGVREKGVHMNRKWMGGETTLKSLWNSDLRGGKLV